MCVIKAACKCSVLFGRVCAERQGFLTAASLLCAQVYVSYDYGTTFVLISDKFQFTGDGLKDGDKQIISQFYHSPADNKRVSPGQRCAIRSPAKFTVPRGRYH